MNNFVVRAFTLVNQQVYLNGVGYIDSIQKSFAFACSRQYHISGEIPEQMQVEDLKTLAILYDKNVYLYHEDLLELERFNHSGVGYIILYKDINEVYSVVSSLDENQHVTLFSIHHPLIQKLL